MALVRTRHNRWVTTPRWTWATAGVVAGFAGLATSYAVAMVAGARSAPVVAVADLVIRHTPGPAVEQAIQLFRHHDKTALLIGILVILTPIFAVAGLLTRRSWW